MALDDLKAGVNKKISRTIKLYLYYANTEYLDKLKEFKDDDSFVSMIDEQKKRIESNVRHFKEELEYKKYNFVDIYFREHFDSPQFWAIQIDTKDIFWGYFMLRKNENGEFFESLLNNCFHFDNGDMELDGFSDWINNNFERLEKWSKK